jgi:hypothetical protein
MDSTGLTTSFARSGSCRTRPYPSILLILSESPLRCLRFSPSRRLYGAGGLLLISDLQSFFWLRRDGACRRLTSDSEWYFCVNYWTRVKCILDPPNAAPVNKSGGLNPTKNYRISRILCFTSVA